MRDAAWFRDSTQIVGPSAVLDGHRVALESEFTLTIVDVDAGVRIDGGPVQIRAASQYLVQRGVPLP